MFDAVRNNKKIVQVFLALITLPFAFWGVESYVRNASSGGDVAQVGEVKISQQHFQQALRNEQEALRRRGLNDPKILDSLEARRAVLDNLISEQLLLLEASKGRLWSSDAALREAISSEPGFQENGKFSFARYQSMLQAQGESQTGFEAKVRQELTRQQLLEGIGGAVVLPKAVADQLLRLQTEQRQVQEYRISADSLLAQVKPAEAEVRKYYEDNPKEFTTREQARAEYVVLSLDAVMGQLTVPEAEIKSWYEGHKDRYQQAEERQASHILILADGKASEADKAKAKATAEEVLQQVRKNPASFAELAKKHSQDPGSGSKGGDLGFFGRGAMVKPFEDEAFRLKVGEISGLVQSDYGFHIIKLVAVHQGKERPLAEVRGEIESELKRQSANRKFAEAADAFTNGIYEQSDSLKPMAEKFRLSVQQTGWLDRQPNPANGLMAHPKLLAALFAEDAVKNKRNTEAVEIAPNTLAAARIVDYRPAQLQAFDAVKAEVEVKLKRRQALDLARKQGEDKLAELKKAATDTLSWPAARVVSRMDARALPAGAVDAIFRLDAEKLPAYAGLADPIGGNYFIYKLGKVVQQEAAKTPEQQARQQMLRQQFQKLLAQEEFRSYLAALRARYKVEVNQSALTARDSQ